jgi:hypothetical protein
MAREARAPSPPHGRPQTFFQGGKTILFALKTSKNILFFSKSLKTFYFYPAKAGQGGGRGKSLPCPPPSGRPCSLLRLAMCLQKNIVKDQYKISLNLTIGITVDIGWRANAFGNGHRTLTRMLTKTVMEVKYSQLYSNSGIPLHRMFTF